MADITRNMALWSDVGETVSDVAGGKMARQLLLRQFSGEETYRKQVKLEALKKGVGIQRNNLGELEPTVPMAPEEFHIASRGYADLEKQDFEIRALAGGKVLEQLKFWEEQASKTEDPSQQKLIRQKMNDIFSSDKIYGLPNPFRNSPYDFVADMESKETFEDNISGIMPTLLGKIKEGNYPSKLDAFSKIQALSTAYPKTMEKWLGGKGPWTLEKLQDFLMTPEEKSDVKNKNEIYLKKQEAAIQEAKGIRDLGRQEEKEIRREERAEARPYPELKAFLQKTGRKMYVPERDEAEFDKFLQQKARTAQEIKSEGGFKEWTPEAKNQTFMFNVITGKPPVNAQGFASNDRKDYGKEYAQWQVDKGFRPSDIALIQSDYKAGDMSLKNMSKQEAPMSAFVLNINKQIAKLQTLYKDGDRIGLRLLDLPLRELKVRAKGSGDESVKASYLLEVSNEIGKLSSGASASVQQLSDSAKEDWKKVHDVNLSMTEIMKVLNATRDQANMRIDTWREAKEEVRSSIRFLGQEKSQTSTSESDPLGLRK